MELKITINLENAAFEKYPGTEVARILEDLAHKVYGFDIEDLANGGGGIRDVNGNTVGKVGVE